MKTRAWIPWLLILATISLAGCKGGEDAPSDTGTDTEGEVPECAVDDDCENAYVCDGQERCVDGTCVDGEPVECDDSDPCTTDYCSERDYGCAYDPLDEDGDEHVAMEAPDGTECDGDDCDDSDADVHPGADPDCSEGGDADCDGLPDMDEDGDGFVTMFCGGDDCDDSDESVYPGAEIDCSADDHDCNSYSDADNDGDLYPRDECGGTDCDDEDSDVNPMVAEESCDGIDTNCDGVMHSTEDGDHDGYANPGCGGEDCDDGEISIHPGATDTCNGVDDDCNDVCDDWDACCRDEVGTCTTTGGISGTMLCDGTCSWTACCATYDACWNGHDDDCDGEVDEYIPVGGDIRLTTATGYSDHPVLSWTGSELGIAWQDERGGNHEIYFARTSADGTRIGSDVRVTDAPRDSEHPSIDWTGSGFGLAWHDRRSTDSEIFFSMLSADGTEIVDDVRMTFAGFSSYPSLSWTGSEFGLAWGGLCGMDTDVICFASVLTDGTKRVSDTTASSLTGICLAPSLAWTGSEFGMTWHNDDGLGNVEIYFARLSTDGSVIGSNVRVTSTSGSSVFSSLVWTGSEFGVAWHDDRDSQWEIYLARISAAGAKIGSDVRMTSATEASRNPSLAWTGSEYGLSWDDMRFGMEVFFSRITPTGTISMAETRISSATGLSEHPSLVWMGSEFGLAWADGRDDFSAAEVYTTRIGCP